MFQNSISKQQGFGVVGEFTTISPRKVYPYSLVSTPNANTIGNAFSVVSEGTATVGGTGVFAGIFNLVKEGFLTIR